MSVSAHAHVLPCISIMCVDVWKVVVEVWVLHSPVQKMLRTSQTRTCTCTQTQVIVPCDIELCDVQTVLCNTEGPWAYIHVRVCVCVPTLYFPVSIMGLRSWSYLLFIIVLLFPDADTAAVGESNGGKCGEFVPDIVCQQWNWSILYV